MLTVNADFERSACVRHQLEAVCERDGAIACHHCHVVVNGAACVFELRDLRETLRSVRHDVRVDDGIWRQQQITGAISAEISSTCASVSKINN